MLMDKGLCGAENLSEGYSCGGGSSSGNIEEASSDQCETKSGGKTVGGKPSCTSPGSAITVTSVTSAKIPARIIKVLYRELY